LKPISTHLATPAEQPPLDEYAEAPVWLQRLFAATYVLFCIVLGTWLVALPWIGRWFDEGLVTRWPELQRVLQHGFVRGAVTGLGLIDIWLGVWQAVHYRDRVPGNASRTNGNTHDRQQQTK
jgi:hypothetical protein